MIVVVSFLAGAGAAALVYAVDGPLWAAYGLAALVGALVGILEGKRHA